MLKIRVATTEEESARLAVTSQVSVGHPVLQINVGAVWAIFDSLHTSKPRLSFDYKMKTKLTENSF